MARRTTAKGKAQGATGRQAKARARAKAAADPVVVAMELAGKLGWQGVSLTDIAAESGMKLSELFPRYPSKTALVSAFMARVDAEMLDQMAGEPADEPLRDRLFAAIMARFDALQPHREGVLAVARASARDPIAGLCLAAGPMRRSLDALLVAVGLPADGLAGAVRRKAVGAIYLAGFRAWSRDDSADMGPTMAALDRLLTRWLPLMERFEGRRRPPAAQNDGGARDGSGAAAMPAG